MVGPLHRRGGLKETPGAIRSQPVPLVSVLFLLAWMLLTVGCVLFASAFASPNRGGFSFREPNPRQRNIGCLTGLLAIALGVIAVIVAIR